MLLQLPDQVCQQPGPAVLYLNYGAPPLRPVPHAPLQPRQPAPGQRVKGDCQDRGDSMKYSHHCVVIGGVQICDITSRRSHPGHRPGHLFQEPRRDVFSDHQRLPVLVEPRSQEADTRPSDDCLRPGGHHQAVGHPAEDCHPGLGRVLLPRRPREAGVADVPHPDDGQRL